MPSLFPLDHIIPDTCIEVLVLRGAMLMARFLEGRAAESIAWLEKKQRREDLRRRPGYWFRVGVIAPMTLTGIFLYRGTGLRDLMTMLSALREQGEASGMLHVTVLSPPHQISSFLSPQHKGVSSMIAFNFTISSSRLTPLPLLYHSSITPLSLLHYSSPTPLSSLPLLHYSSIIPLPLLSLLSPLSHPSPPPPSPILAHPFPAPLPLSLCSLTPSPTPPSLPLPSGLSAVIPFNEAGKVFGGAPLSYFCGAVFAAVVDVLRGMNFLL